MRKISTLKFSEDIDVRKFENPHFVSGEQINVNDSMYDSWFAYDTGVLIFVTSGGLIFQIAQGLLPLRPGMMIYLPPQVPRKIKYCEQNAMVWRISIPKENLSHLPEIPNLLDVSRLTFNLCERIVSWGRLKPEQVQDENKRLIAAFYDELKNTKSLNDSYIPFPENQRLCMVAEHIVRAPHDRRSVAEWAKTSGMSIRSFSGQFLAETGMSFSYWRQHIRLQAAMRLLFEEQSVSQVAFDLGYPSPSSFVASFRKQFGMPPKQYILKNKPR